MGRPSEAFLLRHRGEVRAQEMLLELLEPTIQFVVNQHHAGIGQDWRDRYSWAQEGALNAIRDFDSAKGSGFRTFAAMCIRRNVISGLISFNRLKHRHLNQAVSYFQPVHGSESPLYEMLPGGQDPLEVVLAREEFDDHHRAAVGALLDMSELQHQAVLLVRVDGLSYEAAGRVLGVGVKAIDNALQRAERQLEAVRPKAA